MACDQLASWLDTLSCCHAFPVMTSRIPSRTVCKAEWSLSSLTCFPPGYSIRTSEKKLIIVLNGERFKLRDTLLTRNFHLLLIVSNDYHPFSVPSCSGLEANSVNLRTNKQKTSEQNGRYFKLMFYNSKVFNTLYISNSSLNRPLIRAILKWGLKQYRQCTVLSSCLCVLFHFQFFFSITPPLHLNGKSSN